MQRVSVSVASAPAIKQVAQESPTDRIALLEKAKGLLDSGVLTQEEFEAEKERILKL